MASFSVSGLVPISAAIAGSDVAITVESMFSMNRAVATMSGMRRCLSIGDAGRRGEIKMGCIIQLSWRLLRKATAYLHPTQRVPCPREGLGPRETGIQGRALFTKSCAWQPNPLIRAAAMLGTSVNPTDGLRFEGRAARYSRGRRSSQDASRRRAAERSWQWLLPQAI